ncbi:MAG TPA: cytochrome c peroxidase [Phnomibacter sp.]|nr:cytochrome c peroxidase [Phnomibacter sp.]
MKKGISKIGTVFLFLMLLTTTMLSCKKGNEDAGTPAEVYPAILRQFGGRINPDRLDAYGSQAIPAYIVKNNATGITLSNEKATLGRVLFYDKNLSVNNTISCGSCHQQEFAFSDTAAFSRGILGGITGRHSMRLINPRFATEVRFFWDERAPNLLFQTTQPIRDHAEMGFSGQAGRPDFNTLLTKLQNIDYYNELFRLVYNDTRVTEQRIQECLTHFIQSITSFDSKFDEGRRMVPNEGPPFPNFSQLENQGKQLFLAPPQFNANGQRIGGGAGCQGCHRAPEFDIDPASRNNGVIAARNGGTDINNTRSPSLRDLLNPSGALNGPFMHTGSFRSLGAVVDHYNAIPGLNPNLDPRLSPGGNPQRLVLTDNEKQALVAFLQTLTGRDIYTNVKWSDPF